MRLNHFAVCFPFSARGKNAGSIDGILPCFFGGFVSRLFQAATSARISFGRVWAGSITSSMKPRSAAT